MVRRQEILNFMAPTQKECNLGVKSVKLMYSLKNLLLYSWAWSIQTSKNDQGSVYQNYKYYDPWVRGSCAGAWSYSEHAIFPLLFLSTLGHGSGKLDIKQ